MSPFICQARCQPGTPMLTIIALFDIQSHDIPVAIGAPMHGETIPQMGQTPKHEREPRQQSSENEDKPLLRGGRW